MGNILACFGSSKDQKREAQKEIKVLPRDQKHGSQKPLQPSVSSEQGTSAKPTKLISEVQDKVEGQLSPSPRKKVTFDANIKTYEPVSLLESTEFLLEKSDKDLEEQKEESSGKSNFSPSLSEEDSISLSSGSYPPNHRYQNCIDSDDEVDEFECEESDLDQEEGGLEDYGDSDDDEDNEIVGQEVWSESIPTELVGSRTEISSAQAVMEEVTSPLTILGFPEQEVKKIRSNQNARDRSVYVHSVLNPVENLSQWKIVKSKAAPPLKSHKENSRVEQEEPRISFSSEQTFKHSSFSFKSKSDQSKNPNQEIALDASLSNWLASSETTPTKKASSIGLETIISERGSMSQGSNSVISMEDRPILGTLTVEELKQFSASASPRRSPSRSPDEMPIIGTVGTYWSLAEPANESGSVSSYKGIPNTTSKYREDKRVSWHSTPFETRLERALNRHASQT